MAYSTCNFTKEIDENECIGDSLTTINANFSALDVAVCNLSPALTVNDSSTIDLTLTNNNVLSADVRPDSIRYSQLASIQTLSGSSLSGEAVQPRVAKAWVFFAGKTAVPGISSSFNVLGVTTYASGHYKIIFETPMSTVRYCVFMTGNVYSSATTAGYGIKDESSDPFSTSNSGNNFDNAMELSAVKVASYQGLNQPVRSNHNFVSIYSF